jgi:ribosomal protein L32
LGKDKNWYPDASKNPYRVKQSPSPSAAKTPSGSFIDFNTQRVCPGCGKSELKLSHNFCKYCGVDLSEIDPIGNSDEVSKQLAITAVTDTEAEIRRKAVDTLGDFGDTKVLGVLTYVLFNDPDPDVRKEACDELGDLHHPISLTALTKALKDQDASVRKEAIEGLKKIKEKNKPKKHEEEKDKDEDGE